MGRERESVTGSKKSMYETSPPEIKKKKNGLSRLPGRDGGSGERNLEREIGKNPIPLRV